MAQLPAEYSASSLVPKINVMPVVAIVGVVIFLLLTGTAGIKILLFFGAVIGLIVGLIMLFICAPIGVALEIFCGIMLEILLSVF